MGIRMSLSFPMFFCRLATLSEFILPLVLCQCVLSCYVTRVAVRVCFYLPCACLCTGDARHGTSIVPNNFLYVPTVTGSFYFAVSFSLIIPPDFLLSSSFASLHRLFVHSLNSFSCLCPFCLLLPAAHGAVNSPTLSIHFSSINVLFLLLFVPTISQIIASLPSSNFLTITGPVLLVATQMFCISGIFSFLEIVASLKADLTTVEPA
jgi:hypothetical protein